MRRNKKRTNSFLWAVTLALAIPVFSWNPLNVKAIERYDDPIGIIAGYTNEKERVFLSGAVTLSVEGGNQVLVTGYCEPGADIALVFMENLSNMDFSFQVSEVENESSKEHNMTMWNVTDVEGIPEDRLAEVSVPVQNEKAVLAYWIVNGDDVEKATAEVTIKDLQGEQLIVEDIPEGVVYPAPILKETGEVVAIAVEGNSVYHFGATEETFYGNSGGGQEGEDSQGDPGQEDQNGGSQGDDSQGGGAKGDATRERQTGGTNQISNKKNESGLMLVLAGAGAVICIAAVLIVVLVIVSKKSSGSKNISKVPGGGGIQPPPEDPNPFLPPDQTGGVTTPLNGGGYYDPVPPTVPVQQETGLWLAARGGYMDGRVYPIEQGGVTIGRDVSNMVNYPKDVAGVSRTHAKLFWENGSLKLMDCNSSYGTFLKGTGKLQPMCPVEIKVGDVFYIAEKNNRFEIKN